MAVGNNVFSEAKTPWKMYIVLFGLIVALVVAVWFYWPIWSSSGAEKQVVANPQDTALVQMAKKVAELEKSNGEINASLKTAIADMQQLREEMQKCCQCKKKPVVKKPTKPRVSKPAAPVVPKYVPPVYNQPTIRNPETGKMVPTMPLGVQPVMSCNNKGEVPCAK